MDFRFLPASDASIFPQRICSAALLDQQPLMTDISMTTWVPGFG